MTHLLAVDGHSLAHRAFHALRGEDDLTEAWLAGGVVRMLATVWIEGPFDAVVVAFDARDNRRKDQDPGYKAHREAKDPELYAQIDLLRTTLTDCGFTVVLEPGAEADDLLAAAADACVARGWWCTVLSSDRDLTALVSERVRLIRPRASMTDLRIYDPAEVQAEYGIRPDQYTDFAALRGDPSDGLQGVNGIGPKTAARLLRDYGDIPGIYGALCNLPPKIEAQLRAGRENVERNLWLMAPIPNLEVDVDAAVTAGIDLACLERALVSRGLGRAAGQFRHAVERPPLPPMPPPPEAPEPAVARAATAAPRRTLAPVAASEQASLF